MNLNLDNARLSREIEDRIKAELRRLPATEQKFVLERVAVDVLAGLSGPNGSSAASRPTTPQASSGTSADALATATTSTHWEAIVAYCRAHDPDGSFHNTDLAKALFPEKMKKNRNVAISTIYTATKRRSVDDSSDPYFVLLKKGRFRLATAEERAKAKEKREG